MWKDCVAEDMKLLGFEVCDVKWRKWIMGNRLTRASMDTTDVNSSIYMY